MKQLVNLKRIKSAKLGVIYLVGLHLLVLVLFFNLYNSYNSAPRWQIEKIAMAYAYQDCLDEKNPDFDCSGIVLSLVKPVGFEFNNVDVPYWYIGYKSDTGESLFTGSIMLSINGEKLSLEDTV